MFTIRVTNSFQASHQLTLSDGLKEKLHSHDWEVAVEVSSERLNDMGLVMDFVLLKGIIDGVTDVLEGEKLEEIECFQQHGSSAEIVAKYIYDEVSPQLPANVSLCAVSVVEAPGCLAKFSK